jgi:hypothetical protein
MEVSQKPKRRIGSFNDIDGWIILLIVVIIIVIIISCIALAYSVQAKNEISSGHAPALGSLGSIYGSQTANPSNTSSVSSGTGLLTVPLGADSVTPQTKADVQGLVDNFYYADGGVYRQYNDLAQTPAQLLAAILIENDSESQISTAVGTFRGLSNPAVEKYAAVILNQQLNYCNFTNTPVSSVDLRNISPDVSNQGGYGSCYAFAVRGAMGVNYGYQIAANNLSDNPSATVSGLLLSAAFIEFLYKRESIKFGSQYSVIAQGGSPSMASTHIAIHGCPLEIAYSYPTLVLDPSFLAATGAGPNAIADLINRYAQDPTKSSEVWDFIQKTFLVPDAYVFSQADHNINYPLPFVQIPAMFPDENMITNCINTSYTQQQRVKLYQQILSLNLAISFGIPLFDNWTSTVTTLIPLPTSTSKLVGGHALVIVGYGDSNYPNTFTIRNSWGTSSGGKKIGDDGYFHLPYDYIGYLINNSPGYLSMFSTLFCKSWAQYTPASKYFTGQLSCAGQQQSL